MLKKAPLVKGPLGNQIHVEILSILTAITSCDFEYWKQLLEDGLLEYLSGLIDPETAPNVFELVCAVYYNFSGDSMTAGPLIKSDHVERIFTVFSNFSQYENIAGEMLKICSNLIT